VVAGNRISHDSVSIPLTDIFKNSEVKIINDEITGMDFNSKKLISKTSQYSYDYLIIATGSEPNFYGIPGMEDHSFPLWSLENAVRIREHIKSCFRKASMENDDDKIKALLTFVVGGGGFTGVEMIGEIAHWIKSLCKEYNIARSSVKLVLVEASPAILHTLSGKNINRATEYLIKRLNVEVMTNCSITKLNADSVEFKDGKLLPTNTLIWSAGVRASCITDVINIIKCKACRIRVNEYTQTQYPDVYSVGDVSAFESNGSILPTLVEGALQTGDAAAKNILADIRGDEKEKLQPKLHGVVVSIGSSFAVAEIMGFRFPPFIAVLLKYLVNLHYIYKICGFKKVIKYLIYEFVNKETKITPFQIIKN
jgi:NADH dehydrogenase